MENCLRFLLAETPSMITYVVPMGKPNWYTDSYIIGWNVGIFKDDISVRSRLVQTSPLHNIKPKELDTTPPTVYYTNALYYQKIISIDAAMQMHLLQQNFIGRFEFELS